MNAVSRPRPQEYVRGVVAIVRLERIDEPEAMVEALAAGGIRYVEFTLGSGGAIDAIQRSVQHAVPDVVIGAGTVLEPTDVADVAAAGAAFCVSPHTDTDVIRACLDRGLVPVPGAFTSTEIVQALRAGARSVKLFPAGVVGPSLIRALRGPFPDVDLIPTGAIRLSEAGDYRRAGAAGVGIGSDLVGDGRGSEELTAAARRATDAWRT